jgi:hypothetical protein
MKKFKLLAGLLLAFTCIEAQTSSYLIGSFWNGSSEITRHLNVSTGATSNLATMAGVNGVVQGETTYDAVNHRYFEKTNVGINIIDANTGVVLNVLTPSINFKGMQYNPNTGMLLGTYWTGSAEVFAYLDPTSGAIISVATLSGVTSIVQGESTFDPTTNKYFMKTGSSSFCVINAVNGSMTNLIASSPLKGIEFNLNTGSLVGSYWTGSSEVFASMNITTGAVTSIATLPGVTSIAQGETTFDAGGNIYFNKTNLGILVINANSGSIINSFSGSILKSMEFIGALSNPCNFTTSISPTNVYTTTGGSASFTCMTTAASPGFQWQSNPANFGWTNVPNNATYSGANTSVLTVNNVSLQNHLQPFRVIVSTGSCLDTSEIATLHITDTCIIYEVITDTLFIQLGVQSNSPVSGNLIKVYPNPATTYLMMDNGNLSLTQGYSIKISDSKGQSLYSERVTEKIMQIDLSTFSTKGIYYLHMIDEQGSVVQAKKIVIK